MNSDKIKKFIEAPDQRAIVTEVIQYPDKTKIVCYSPVWKEIEFISESIGIERFDKVLLSRIETEKGLYNYRIKENLTVAERRTKAVQEILHDFTPEESRQLMLISERQRLQNIMLENIQNQKNHQK